MNFKQFIIEKHLSHIDYDVVRTDDGKFKINFSLKDEDDADLKKHVAAHAAMEMNRSLATSTYDTPEEAEDAAQKALNVNRNNNMGYVEDETVEEEAPTNSVGGGENIAGINPPAGPGPLTSRNLRGVAFGYTPEQIADRHGVDLNKIMKQIEMGIEVEKEHTDNANTAMKIAMDHVFEDPRYYSKLARMEGKSNKKNDVDIGNDTKFIGMSDPLSKYRVPTFQTRRTTTNKPGEERI